MDGMRIEIEFKRTGINHFDRINRYDDFLGKMVKGFQFRVRPLFFVVMW